MPFVPQAPLVHDPQEAEWFDPAGLLSRLKDLRAHVAGAEMSELAEARLRVPALLESPAIDPTQLLYRLS